MNTLFNHDCAVNRRLLLIITLASINTTAIIYCLLDFDGSALLTVKHPVGPAGVAKPCYSQTRIKYYRNIRQTIEAQLPARVTNDNDCEDANEEANTSIAMTMTTVMSTESSEAAGNYPTCVGE